MRPDSVLYLSRENVANLGLSMPTIIDAVENMFREKGEGRVEMPPKPGIHTQPDAFIHAMPAYIPSLGAAGVKWISGYPGNQAKGLPYITGLLILNDPETGVPTAIMDATWLTAQRTGAATAVAARHLARPNSSTAGIIACGVQGRSNLEALACVFSLEKVWAYDRNREVAETFATDMSAALDVQVEVVTEPRAAVVDADLVVTSGPILKAPTPVIDTDWLAPGAFASPVDFDSYWTGGALRQADKLATDDIAQFEHYREAGYFSDTPAPYADLGQIVAGHQPGREREDERTIAINLGLALEDMATAMPIYERAIELGVGTRLPL
ncbi:MAG: ornithine cyclodeaminase family protein [Gemmatimonadetes bacterium]|nr:ornithine cyclodeaminase family protein [Gemmatimonadota bacterium]MBT6629446.1 ornithine cyclodeaminase family protein [Gemmatimonadota bacterium]